jgi:predicted RNA binding protein YcfA (HicA-like mRNA interferase family)
VAKLPRGLSGKEVVKAFGKIGYVADRRKGSHIVLINEERRLPRLSVPAHKTIRVGLLRKFVRDVGLTVEEFLALLK